MKRHIMLLALLFAVTVCAFAQNYIVQSVTGRVQQEKDGVRVDMKSGDTLTAETIIYTGVGASLVLKEGDNIRTVPAARNGKVAELAAAPSGARIGGSIAKTDTAAVSRTTGQASTASARSSDAAGDNDIAAE